MKKSLLIDTSQVDETVSIIIENEKIRSVYYDIGVIKKGNIYAANIANIDYSLNALFVNFGGNKTGFISIDNIHDRYFNGKDRDLKNLSPNQIFLVQIEKEERQRKGAFLTTYICLSGRYCILMIDAKNNNGGISKKIIDNKERDRLNAIRSQLNLPDGMNVILRTAVAQAEEEEVKHDCAFLLRIWEKIETRYANATMPCLVHAEASGVHKSLREWFTNDIECVKVLNAHDLKEAKSFFQLFAPRSQITIELMNAHDHEFFWNVQFEEYIKQLSQNRITLPAGGYISVTTTEALTAIDVNSGKTKQSSVLINAQAAKESVKQIISKGLHGLVVIDFIDMNTDEDAKQIEQIVKEGFLYAKPRIKMNKISTLGLMELSIQRVQPSIYDWLLETCRTCSCIGATISMSFLGKKILRMVYHQSMLNAGKTCRIIASKRIILWLLNERSDFLLQLRALFKIKVKMSSFECVDEWFIRLEWI